MEETLLAANEWYTANKIMINVEKTELKIYCNFKVTLPLDFSIQTFSHQGICKYVIKPSVQNSRYLGFFLDENHNYETFFKVISSRVALGISSLAKLKNFIPQKTKLLLYHAFVHSHLEFASLYFELANNKMKKYLFKLQKRAIRYVVNAKKSSHTAQIFDLLEILPLSVLSTYNSS